MSEFIHNMKVVLDSNIIIADFHFSSSEFKILLTSAKIRRIELYIPHIVLDEVFNKFRQQLEKSQSEICSGFENLNRLTKIGLESGVSNDFIAACKCNYESYIEEVISIHNIQIIPYPNTSHQYLAKKAMHIKKPFNINEKGYRDSLIWESVKSLISKDNAHIETSLEVVFITGNYKDFLTDEGDFHDDLLSELKIEGIKSESIFALRSVRDFNNNILLV